MSSPLLGSPEYDKINEEHARNPQPGDYWHEHFCPQFVVLARWGAGIVIVYKTKREVEGGWTWDTSKPEFMSIYELYRTVTYTTMPDKFVADCSPGRHKAFADEFLNSLWGSNYQLEKLKNEASQS